MYPFQYQRADSVEQAVDLLQGDGDAKLLAGGQTLLASLKLRLAQPSKLIDLGRIEGLRGIAVEPGETLTVGAMTTHHAVAASPEVNAHLPSLASLALHIGDPMIRRRGTLGGSIANNDPAADYPAALLALDATVYTSSRTIAADDFVVGMFETALAPDEIVQQVQFRIPRRAAYVKFKHPASRFAIVGVYVAQFADETRVAVTGAGAFAFRQAAMEAALHQRFDPAALDPIEVEANGLNADLQATADYRASLVKVIAKRAVLAARDAFGTPAPAAPR